MKLGYPEGLGDEETMATWQEAFKNSGWSDGEIKVVFNRECRLGQYTHKQAGYISFDLEHPDIYKIKNTYTNQELIDLDESRVLQALQDININNSDWS